MIGVVTTPIIVRLLGGEGYGDFALLMSIFGILSVFTQSGIFNGLRKYLAEDQSTENWDNQVFGFYVQISLLVTGFFAITIAFFAHTRFVETWFSPEFQTYFILLAAYLFVSQFYSLSRGVLMGVGLEHHSEPIRIIKKMIYVVSAIALLYIGFGVRGVLLGQIIAATATGVLSLYLIKGIISFKSIWTPVSSQISRFQLLTFNVHSVLLAFLTVSLYHIDVLLLRPTVGATQTGYYKGALVLAEFLWVVPSAIQYALVQSASEMWSQEEYERITEVASISTRFNLSLMIIMVLGLAVLARDFVPLYFGQEFTPAVEPLLLLLPGVLGFALARPIFAIGQGKGEIKNLVLATGGAAVLNLLLNLLLIPRYGTRGAAIATSIGYGSMAVFHILIARQIGFNPIADLRLFRITIAGLLSAPIIYAVARVLPTLPSLIIVPPTGFCVYMLLSVQLGVVDKEELMRLQEKAPRQTDRIFKWLIAVKK
jgi:O-antigen/teichoic acid export membrane protein